MNTLNLQAEVSVEHRGWDIWLWWLAYTVLGYFILGAVTIVVIRFTPGGLLLGIGVGAVGMGVVGFMQWSVLRRYLLNMHWLGWALATVLGQLVGMIIAMITAVTVAAILGPWLYYTLGGSIETIGGPAVRSTSALVNGAVFGTVIGFAQWLILRHYLQAAAWWVPATAVAMAVSSVVSKLWLSGVGSEGLMALPLTMGVTGVIVGAITGIALVRLLRRSIKICS